MPFSKSLLTGLTLTRENFKTPPREMGILPFWFWNGELDEKEMEWQLREYHRKGIPGLFIHGRFGLKVPYLSEQWFERAKFVVAKAKEIGIDIWVYDEMNWPSGTAERQVPTQYPHLAQRYLELVALHVPGPLFTFLEATDNRYVNTGDSKPVAAFACTAEEFETEIKNLIDLTPNLSFNKVIPWEAPAGDWKLLYFLEKEVPYYIDTLNPESTQRFLEITHERYKNAVGADFGTIVPGFYTDEPAMHYYHVGIDNYVVPWSSQMFKIFRERRGYDLRPYLPALYTSIGEKTAEIRYDFWRTLTEQYSATYYKQIRDWCEANGVLFTGHLLFEEWLRLQARCEGNLFKYLKHMHIIGVDHLYPKIGSEAEPDQHVALKIGSSAAHHFGSTRLLCESMGGTYWDCSLERMKWMTNWEYVLGVNLFNNHGYHYSIEGERKRDWPPSQFYHHTWWKYYDQFTTYAARLSHILSGGRHVAKALVLYPINSIWTNYVPQQRNAIGNVIESDFNYLTDTLLRLHYDFDYVDEDVLAQAIIQKGKIKIADEEYSILILPPVTHIKKSTFQQMKRFVAAGGNVIADTLLPTAYLESKKNGATKDVQQLFGVNPAKLLDGFQNGARFTVKQKRGKGKAFVMQGKGLHQSRKKAELKRILNLCAPPDVTISREEVFYLHRVKDGHDIYFFVNTLQQDLGGVEISFEQKMRPELWNPNTGDSQPLQVYDVKNGRVTIMLDFPASESHVVVMREVLPKSYVSSSNLQIAQFDETSIVGYGNPSQAHAFAVVKNGRNVKRFKSPAKRVLKPIKLGREFDFKLHDDNVLCLGNWKMTIARGDGVTMGFHHPQFDDSGWLNVTHGAWEMQLAQERDQETYPVTLWYRTAFEIGDLPSNTRVLIDGFSGSSRQLFVNGQPVTDAGRRSQLDAEIKEVNIQPFVKAGRNVVAVKLIVTRRTDGILDLLKIIGDFALASRKAGTDLESVPAAGLKIVAPKSRLKIGDWTQQGYPFFSGSASYTAKVEIAEKYLSGRLFLETDCGEDVLEVIVNDHTRVVPWHPYRVEITDLIRAGKNTITLKVTNTVINILEGVRKASGLFSPPRISHEHRYEFTL
ncbi:MAG TPA: glycosyl hydrolase [bacterium]